MYKDRKGFTALILVIAFLFVLTSIGGSYYHLKQKGQSSPNNLHQKSRLFLTREECERETKSNCHSYICDIPLGEVYQLLCKDGKGEVGWFSSDLIRDRSYVKTNEIIISVRTEAEVYKIAQELGAQAFFDDSIGYEFRKRLKFPQSDLLKLQEISTDLERQGAGPMLVNCKIGEPDCVDYDLEMYRLRYPGEAK